MFSLREFVKSGLIKAIGKMADYQVILNAAGWHEKGVLEETDLAEIQEYVAEFCKEFDCSSQEIMNSPFTVVTPDSKNPYKQMYVAN